MCVRLAGVHLCPRNTMTKKVMDRIPKLKDFKNYTRSFL